MHVRAKSSFLELLRYKEEEKPWDLPSPQEIARFKHETLALKEKMLAEFPALRVEPRPVPEERNGFLALHRLAGSDYAGPPVRRDFGGMIGGSASWDSAAVKAGLEAHADVVAEYERIAAMEERSSANMPPDYVGFASARTAKLGTDLLLAKARLAAEAGDEEDALRLVAAAQNLASHFREVESPNLLFETVVLLIDLSVQKTVFEHLLPAFGRDSDLSRWKSALFQRPYDPGSFAKVMRGEWDTVAELMLFPTLVNRESPNCPPDGEGLARVYSSALHDAVNRLRTCGLAELHDASYMPAATGDFPELSDKSREILEMLWIGSKAWGNGYVRAAATIARNRAALDLLIREKEGEAGELGVDPLSGQPFVFDSESRTLAMPEANFEREIEPLKLPW